MKRSSIVLDAGKILILHFPRILFVRQIHLLDLITFEVCPAEGIEMEPAIRETLDYYEMHHWNTFRFQSPLKAGGMDSPVALAVINGRM